MKGLEKRALIWRFPSGVKIFLPEESGCQFITAKPMSHTKNYVAEP